MDEQSEKTEKKGVLEKIFGFFNELDQKIEKYNEKKLENYDKQLSVLTKKRKIEEEKAKIHELKKQQVSGINREKVEFFSPEKLFGGNKGI